MFFAGITLAAALPASADPLLDAALDLDSQGLTVTSSSAAQWEASTSGAHDGVDVGVSPVIGDDESTSFELVLIGPDTVSFWWRVSSEPTFDTLSVSVNGIVEEVISGETQWEERVINLPAGFHTVRWTYAKDFESEPGPQQDRAWVDEIRVASKFLPTVEYPETIGVYVGEPVDIEPLVIGNATAFNLVGDLPAGLQFDVSTGRIFGRATTGADVMVSVTADSPNGTTAPVEIGIQVLDLGEGVEAPVSGWTWEGDAPWFTQTTHSFDGVDAVQSGAIGPGQSSQLNLPVTGPSVVRFRWRVDSEGEFDKLAFLLDGEVVQEISDFVDWERRAFEVPAGEHVISWRYQKDALNDEGEDAAWLDDLEIIDSLDPDGDGLCTILEVCLGLDAERPSIDAFKLPIETDGRLSWEVELGPDVFGLGPVIEISYDLKTWSATPLTLLPDSGDATRIAVVETVPNLSPYKFVRLRAAGPDS